MPILMILSYFGKKKNSVTTVGAISNSNLETVCEDKRSVKESSSESYAAALVDVVSDIIMYMASYVVLVTAFIYLTVLHGITTFESISYYVFGIVLIIINSLKSANIVSVRMVNFGDKKIKYHRILAVLFCLALWYLIFGQIIPTVFSSMK